MSLFKPSNLSPNFESVTNGKPLTITFQVNSNGSTVNAYRVQILKDVNDKDNSEDNILGSIYGTFEKPLYNKDIGEIILEEETLKYNGIELEPNKDYRWTLRLYGEDKRGNNYISENLTMGFGTANAIKGIDIAKPFVINKNNLFDIKENLTLSSSSITYSINNTAITFKSNNTSNAHFYYSVSVRAGETYTVSVNSIDWDSSSYGIFLSSTKTADLHDYGQIDKTISTQTFVATTNTLWIHGYISYVAGDFTFTFDKLKVERGSKRTDYTSYCINDEIYSDTWEDYGLIISQDDISGIMNNLIYSLPASQDYDIVDSIEEFSEKIRKYTTKFSIILFSEIQDKTQQELNEFLKNKIHPKMYLYQINIAKNINDKYTIYFSNSNPVFSFNYYKSNYQKIYNEDLTYIGSGNLVGSTRQTMWSTKFNEAMKINSYARIMWRPSQHSYFQPFKFNTQTITYTASGNNAVTISANDIKKEYIEKITDGNFYILLSPTKTPFETKDFDLEISDKGSWIFNSNKLKEMRRIENIQHVNYGNEYLLTISNNETIPNINGAEAYKYLTIVYIQQEKIIQVDKNIGKNNLTKISFEESFNYNPNQKGGIYTKQYLHLGYVNNDFDYDRFYIDPIEEFDNSTGFSYIILQKSTTPITGDGSATDGRYITQTRLDKLLSSTDQTQVGYKIINYVGKTGEVTIYNKAKNLPTIQTFYYIYKRNNSDNTKYDKITSGWLGGKQENSCDIVVNSFLQVIGNEAYCNFENIFIQPNIGIKQDDYMPMKLSVYNEKYTKDIYLTNYYNFWNTTTTPFSITNVKSNTEVIDTLDDTMYLITAKEITNKDSTMMLDNNTIFTLYEPQTQYKIYTNFVDSIPEGFFYSRYDKTIKFEIYDLNTYKEKEQIPYIIDNNIITYNGEKVDSIPYRDLYVKSVCQDYKLVNGVKEELGTNYVTLKEYHFDVLTNEQKVVYSTEENYDGKYKLEFRGCNNNSTYYIKSYIEDNYGKLYTYQARIPIKYTETLSDTNINVTTMCEEQAIKIDFTPVRQIESSGSLIYNEPYADTNYSNNPLTFYEYDNNIVSIPSEFSYCVQFKLDSNMIDKNTRLKILEVTTDNGNKYNLYFDTEAYFKVTTNEENKFAINKTYAKFILSNRDLANNENITKDSDDIKILDSKISNLVIPTQFAYIISNTQEVNNNYIYIMPSKISDIYIDDQTNFKNTVPESCIDSDNDTLKLIGRDTYFVETNNEDYINVNRTALTNMRDLIFTMTVKYDSTTKKYKITKATIS